MKNQSRRSNIEVLRILSIFIIILSHWAQWSGFEFDNLLAANAIYVTVLHSFGKLGVTVFIAISSYFVCRSKQFKLSRQIKLIFEIIFYNILIVIISLLIGTFSIKGAAKELLSIICNTHPFVTGYIILMFLSPWLNHLCNSISKTSHFILCLFLFSAFYIIPTFIGIDAGYEIIYYIFIYIFMSFYRRLEDGSFTVHKPLLKAIILFIAMNLLTVTITMVGVKFDISYLVSNRERFRCLYSFLVLFIGFFLFVGFKNLHIKNNLAINKIASTTLAIFLLHNSHLLRTYIWNDIFHTLSFADSSLISLILNSLFSAITIFLVGCGIDLIRQIFEKRIMNLIIPRIDSLQNDFFSKIDKHFI